MSITARRTLAEIVVEALMSQPEKVPICYLHQNMTNVRSVKAGTNVTIGVPSHVFTPDDAVWFTGELGKPEERKPKYVGMLVFVPMEIHER